jgi:hypothetical protein
MTQPQSPERTNPFAPPEELPAIPAQYMSPSGTPSPHPIDGNGGLGGPPGQAPYPPAAWPPYEAAPWQYAPPASPSASPTGFAVAALVLGIVGVLLSWLPFLGLVMGVLAVVFGIVAVRRSRRSPTKPDYGKAVTGIVTGCLAVVAGIAFFALAVATWDDSSEADAGSGGA